MERINDETLLRAYLFAASRSLLRARKQPRHLATGFRSGGGPRRENAEVFCCTSVRLSSVDLMQRASRSRRSQRCEITGESRFEGVEWLGCLGWADGFQGSFCGASAGRLMGGFMGAA